MKRRHQVNHEPAMHSAPPERRRALYGAAGLVLALGISTTLATPLFARPDDSRAVSLEASSTAPMDWGITTDTVHVNEYAPLAVFGGSGINLDIDGRPSYMMKDGQGSASSTAPDQQARSTRTPDAQYRADQASTLLAGEVGQIGQLPGGLELMPPVTTRRISSPYGWRANPTGSGNQIHIGQDYPIACGSPVYASESGTVTVSSWAGHSGMRITIDHGHNVQTGYSHNSVLIAKVGQEVRRGELIARSGTTGNSTGCHVHFEVIINGRWHDPRNYLPRNPDQAQAMIDSRRLTVSANSAPKGSNPSTPSRQRDPQKDTDSNPDVVVPKDDTPVVPKPSPSPTPKAPTAKPTPTATAKPRPTPTGSATPTKPTKTSKPTETATTNPTPEPTSTPKPTPSATVEPTETTASPSASSPTESAKPSGSGTSTATAEDSTPPIGKQDTSAPETTTKPTKVPTATATPTHSASATQNKPKALAPEPEPETSPTTALPEATAETTGRTDEK